MTILPGFPLPATSSHDEHGNHIRPVIPAWRRSPGAHTVKGSEVEADQRRKAAFAVHLAEHRRLGQPSTVVDPTTDA